MRKCKKLIGFLCFALVLCGCSKVVDNYDLIQFGVRDVNFELKPGEKFQQSYWNEDQELIYTDNKYCSFTKELQQAEDWNNTRDFNQQSCSYIVEIESKGLDIEKVYNKWKDDINTESMSIINDCLFIKEVISKLSHDFKIYSIQGIKDFSKQINSRDELKEFLNA